MTTLKMLLAEIGYRKVGFAMSLLAVLIAITLFVAGPMLVDGYSRETQSQLSQWESQLAESERGVARLKDDIADFESKTAEELARLEKETTRLMRDMGFNLMIVPAQTNMSDFWAADFASATMPQQYVDRLAADRRLTLVTHLVATLQEKTDWENRKVLLVGYLPETTQSHMRHKTPMGYSVQPGTVLLGHELGVGRKAGDTIEIRGKTFRVAQVLPEQGSKEDITIAMHLADAQEILNKKGLVNQIMALGCNCAGSNLPNIRNQLAGILPDTRITEFRSIALARAEERALVETKQKAVLAEMARNLESREKVLSERKQVLADMADSRANLQRVMVTLADVITPLVVLASAVWVGLLALANVRQRRTEIGLLRALGKGSGTIWALFLGKAVILGVVGAAAGCLLGVWTAKWLGVRALSLPADHFYVHYDFLLYALVGAPAVSAVASYLPTLSALLQDPAVVLREQ